MNDIFQFIFSHLIYLMNSSLDCIHNKHVYKYLLFYIDQRPKLNIGIDLSNKIICDDRYTPESDIPEN